MAPLKAQRRGAKGPVVVTSRPDLWSIREHTDGLNFIKPSDMASAFNAQDTNGSSAQPNPLVFIENQLPAWFYIRPAPDCPAVFSTRQGDLPFRHMEHVLPPRSVHMWDRDEIQSACNSLRLLYWDLMKAMDRPQEWSDMWKWFDAHDLYFYGAQNLWNCINHLVDENKIIHADVRKEFALHIGHWADEWCAVQEQKERLKAWNDQKGPIFNILSKKDHEEMGPVGDDIIPMISDALKHRRHLLMMGQKMSARAGPNHLVPACRSGTVHNWMGKSLGALDNSLEQADNV
jgi:hypothetical protein